MHLMIKMVRGRGREQSKVCRSFIFSFRQDLQVGVEKALEEASHVGEVRVSTSKAPQQAVVQREGNRCKDPGVRVSSEVITPPSTSNTAWSILYNSRDNGSPR